MNLEQRIVELLAEYLKKGDQLSDRADKTDRSIEIMSRALAANDIKYNAANEKFNAMNQAFIAESRSNSDRFKAMNEAFIAESRSNAEQFKAMNEKFVFLSNSLDEKFNSVTREIKEMRADQSILLKELVSLSKRVATIEE